MATIPYQVQGGDGKMYTVNAPEGATDEQILGAFNSQLNPPTHLGNIERGILNNASPFLTAAEIPFLGANKAAAKALERTKKIEEEHPSAISVEKVSEAYKDKGLFPAVKEAVSQVPAFFEEYLPLMGAMAASSKAGAIVGGSRGGVRGAIVGGIAGGFAPLFIQQTGSNIEQQAAVQQSKDQPIDVNVGKAAAYAVPEAALYEAATFFAVGKPLVGKLFGKEVQELIAKGATSESEKLAERSLLEAASKGTLRNILQQVPTQVAENMMSRAQSGQSLTDSEAFASYGEAAWMGVLGSPIGTLEGLYSRHVARRAPINPATSKPFKSAADLDSIHDEVSTNAEHHRNSANNDELVQHTAETTGEDPELIREQMVHAADHLEGLQIYLDAAKETWWYKNKKREEMRNQELPSDIEPIDTESETTTETAPTSTTKITPASTTTTTETAPTSTTTETAPASINQTEPTPTVRQTRTRYPYMKDITYEEWSKINEDNQREESPDFYEEDMSHTNPVDEFGPPENKTGAPTGVPISNLNSDLQSLIKFIDDMNRSGRMPTDKQVLDAAQLAGIDADEIKKTSPKNLLDKLELIVSYIKERPEEFSNAAGQSVEGTGRRGIDVPTREPEPVRPETKKTVDDGLDYSIGPVGYADEGTGQLDFTLEPTERKPTKVEPTKVEPTKETSEKSTTVEEAGGAKELSKATPRVQEGLGLEDTRYGPMITEGREPTARSQSTVLPSGETVTTTTRAETSAEPVQQISFLSSGASATPKGRLRYDIMRRAIALNKKGLLPAKVANELLFRAFILEKDPRVGVESFRRLLRTIKNIEKNTELKTRVDKLREEGAISQETADKILTRSLEAARDPIQNINEIRKILDIVKDAEIEFGTSEDRKSGSSELLSLEERDDYVERSLGEDRIHPREEDEFERAQRLAERGTGRTYNGEERYVPLTGKDEEFYSQGQTKGSDLSSIIKSIRERFGIHADRMFKTGFVRVVKDVSNLPPRKDGKPHPAGAKGLFDGKTAYLVAKNISADQAVGVLLHEVGVHYGLRKILGDKLFTKLMDYVGKRVEAGDAKFVEARNRVTKNVRAEKINEETAAYMVEHHPELDFVKQIISGVKTFVYQLTGGRIGNLNSNDFRTLAVAALKRASSIAEKEPLYSRTPEEKTTPLYSQTPQENRTELESLAYSPLSGKPYEKDIVQRAINAVSQAKPNIRKAFYDGLSPFHMYQAFHKQFPAISDVWKYMSRRAGAYDIHVREKISNKLEEWRGLMKDIPKEDRAKFNDLAHQSTLYQIEFIDDGKRTFPVNPNSPIYQEWQQLIAKHPVFEQIYTELRDYYDQAREDFIKNVTKNMSPEYAKKVREEYDKTRLGVYLPLFRTGDHNLSYVDKDGHLVTMQFPKARERNRFKTVIEKEGGNTEIRSFKRIEENDPYLTKAPVAFLDAIIKGINSNPDLVNDPKLRQDLIDSAYKFYADFIPANSIRQRFRQRSEERPQGFELDPLTSFANVAPRIARTIINLQYEGPLSKAMTAFLKEIGGNKPEDKYADLYNALKKRIQFSRNPDYGLISKGVDLVNYIDYQMYMGLNASSAISGWLHLPTLVYPTLAGRFGHNAAFGELKNGILRYMDMKNWTPIEQKLYRMAEEHAVIRPEAGDDISQIRRKPASEYSSKWAKTTLITDYLMRKMDNSNRVATLFATYNLARKGSILSKPMSADAAAQFAMDTVMRSYNSSNPDLRFGLLKNNLARTAFLFKSFAFIRTLSLARMYKEAVKGLDPVTKKIARNQILAVYGAAFLFGGAKGLPGSSILLMLANLIQDPDDPKDREQQMRKVLGEFIYDGPISYLTNLAISEKAGWGNMFWKDDAKHLLDVGAFDVFAERLLGPTYGLYQKGRQAYQHYNEHQYGAAIQSLLPTWTNNLVKSMQYFMKGAVNKYGVPIVGDVSNWNAGMQAVGLAPNDLTEARATASAMSMKQTLLYNRKSELLNHYFIAQHNDDKKFMDQTLDEIIKFDKKNPQPNFVITGDTINQFIVKKEKDLAQSVNGVSINKFLLPRFEEEFPVEKR